MILRVFAFLLLTFVSPTLLLAVDISGQVRVGTRSGLPSPAVVQLLRDGEILSEQYSGLDGRFQFLSVEPARYSVRAQFGDLPPSQTEVDALAGKSRYRVTLTILPHPESGNRGIPDLTISRSAKREYEEGVKLRRVGNCEKAAPRFEKAITLAPAFGDAYYELGNCLKLQGNLSLAESALLKAVRYNSTVYPTISMADVYLKQKRHSEAAQLLQGSLVKNPGEGDLFFGLARIYLEQGKIKDAETAALEAHSRFHRSADVHLLLAKIYLDAKNIPALSTQLEAYLSENPNGPAADEARKTLKNLANRPEKK